MSRHAPRRLAAGFSLIEMMVVVVILALMLSVGAPAMSAWLGNMRVRSVAEALRNDLERAKSQAQFRDHVVVLVLTRDEPTEDNVAAISATPTGTRWLLRLINNVPGETAAHPAIGGSFFIRGDSIAEERKVTIASTASMLCFGTSGRLVTRNMTTSDGFDVACAAPAGGALATIDVTQPGSADRPLRVTVSLGGEVRLCDPSKTLASGQPDGC